MLAFKEKVATIFIQSLTQNTARVKLHTSTLQIDSESQAVMPKPPKKMQPFFGHLTFHKRLQHRLALDPSDSVEELPALLLVLLFSAIYILYADFTMKSPFWL
jgi:hypothetical protein